MTDPLSPIGLEEFEAVEAGPGTALLRVVVHPPDWAGSRREPALLIDDGGRRHRIKPLPSPPEPRGMLRLAYSAPLELLERNCAFALELEPGFLMQLPPPNRRTSTPPLREGLLEPREPPPPVAQAEPNLLTSELQRRLEEAGRAAEAEGRRADEATAHMRMLEREHRETVRETESQRDAARDEAASHADRVRDLEQALATASAGAIREADERAAAKAEATAALEHAEAEAVRIHSQATELQRVRTALERRLQESVSQLALLTAARREAERAAGAVHSELGQTRAAMETAEAKNRHLTARVNELESEHHQLLSGAEQLKSQLAIAEESQQNLRRLNADRERLSTELEDLRLGLTEAHADAQRQRELHERSAMALEQADEAHREQAQARQDQHQAELRALEGKHQTELEKREQQSVAAVRGATQWGESELKARKRAQERAAQLEQSHSQLDARVKVMVSELAVAVAARREAEKTLRRVQQELDGEAGRARHLGNELRSAGEELSNLRREVQEARGATARAQQEAQAAAGQARAADARAQAAEGQARTAEARTQAAEGQARAAEEHAQAIHQQMASAQGQARDADLERLRSELELARESERQVRLEVVRLAAEAQVRREAEAEIRTAVSVPRPASAPAGETATGPRVLPSAHDGTPETNGAGELGPERAGSHFWESAFGTDVALGIFLILIGVLVAALIITGVVKLP